MKLHEFKISVQYIATYDQDHYGTERLLSVRTPDNNIIGQCDPFHNGIPVDPKAQRRGLKKAAKQLIEDHFLKMRMYHSKS